MSPAGADKKAKINTSLADTQLPSSEGRKHSYATDVQDLRLAAAPAGQTTGHRKTHNTKKRPGPKRGPRSMGRFPFLSYLEQYLQDYEDFKAGSTLENERRMLRNLHNDIQYLKQCNTVTTTCPTRLTEEDVKAIIRYLKRRDNKSNSGQLDIDTIAKYCQYLSNLLTWCGNPSMIRLKSKGKLPRRANDKEILSLDVEDAQAILLKSQEYGGWQGDVLAFIIPCYLFMGLRAGELQRAELRDINTKKWTFFIRYPKGGQGKQKTMKMPKILRPYILPYLEARRQRLMDCGEARADTLIPKIIKEKVIDSPYTASFYWTIKRQMENDTGITFDYQMLRRTSGQLLKNYGSDIESVSRHLRHTSTQITERYYARIRDEDAFQVVDETWSRSPLARDLKITIPGN